MSNKNKLKKYKKLISAIYWVYLLLPKYIHEVLYDFSRNFEGKLSLLIRYYYLKKYSNKCGENVFIGRNVTLKNIKNLTIGNNVSIHSNSYIDCYGGIFIGSNVSIAANTSIFSSSHTWGIKEVPIKYNPIKPLAIKILDDVWIGTGCKILGGITINSRSIIGAGAVLNTNADKNSLYVGVPAVKKKTIIE